MLGSAIADIPLVQGVCLSCGNGITVIVIDQQQSAVIDTGVLIAIELADLPALFHAEEILAAARSRLLIQVEVSHLVSVARELGQFGLSHAPVDTSRPLKGLLGQHVILECHFHTGILGGTHIYQDGVVDKRRLRCRVVI